MEKFIPELEQRKAEIELAEKIGDAMAEGAADTYKVLEDGVVTGYQKIEDGAVKGFNTIADKFVGAFLTREGETVQEARARLDAEQKAREEKIPHPRKLK